MASRVFSPFLSCLIGAALAAGLAACGKVVDGNLCGNGRLDPGEECDDGNDLDGDNCSSLCTVAEVCGNGRLDPGEECDAGDRVDGDGCSSACLFEICGDGIVQPDFEDCDGTPDCEPSCVYTPCSGVGISILGNGGFESSDLAPWTTNGVAYTTDFSLTGWWSAEVDGNFYLQQDFPPVPASTLISASFWTWHDGADGPAMSVVWTYGDGTQGSRLYTGDELSGWVPIDLLPLLDQTKDLVSLRVWGYSGGGGNADTSIFDLFEFCQ